MNDEIINEKINSEINENAVEETMERDKIRIYLVSPRKYWDYDIPNSWKEIAWERFDYIECAIFEKNISDLTEKDKRWVDEFNKIPEGWIEPSPI